MKKLFAIVLSGILTLLSICPVNANDYTDDFISIDWFDQTDDSLEDWLRWVPVDIFQRKTYHELLKDDLAGTLNDMFKHFDIGLVTGSEYDELLEQYDFTTLTRIYYVDEVQQTFNAVYNTDIDFYDLDGLNNGFIQIIDDYLCVTISPFKTFSMGIYPTGGGLYLSDNEEQWTWAPTAYPYISITGIISYRTVAGYNLRCMEEMEITSNEHKEIRQFRQACTYNGTVYTTNQFNTDSSVKYVSGNVSIRSLPMHIDKGKTVYSFAICDNKIYYVYGSESTDLKKAGIYVCDIDGTNVKLLTDKATNYSHCFLYDNNIYYDNRNAESIQANYSGIYKVNVKSYNTHKIVDDTSAELGMVNTDGRIYYSAFLKRILPDTYMWHYSCDLNGNDTREEAERDDRCGSLTGGLAGTYCVGSAETGKLYYQVNEIIYECDFNSYPLDPVRDITTVDRDVEMLAADMWYVYYARLDNNKAYVYRVPRFKDNTVKVCINGREVEFGEKYGETPSIQNERTIVPMRRIFEALGAKVDWDGTAKTITATHNDVTIKLSINNNTMYVNGKSVYLDVPPMLIGDTTGVPVRAVAEAFNAKVDWDQSTQTVTITK